MEPSFEEVWNRVKGERPKDDLAQLNAFLADERRTAADYGRMTACTGAIRAKRLFRQLAAEENEHARQLQSVAFLLNGKGHVQRVDAPMKPCRKILQEIRRLYANEEKSADAYAKAAGSTADHRLREIYADLASQERKHGEKLSTLLKELM